MKIAINIDIDDVIFRGQRPLEKEERAMYHRLESLAIALPVSMWIADNIPFDMNVRMLFPDKEQYVYDFLNTLHRMLRLPIFTRMAEGLMIHNVQFNRTVGSVLVELVTLADMVQQSDNAEMVESHDDEEEKTHETCDTGS